MVAKAMMGSVGWREGFQIPAIPDSTDSRELRFQGFQIRRTPESSDPGLPESRDSSRSRTTGHLRDSAGLSAGISGILESAGRTASGPNRLPDRRGGLGSALAEVLAQQGGDRGGDLALCDGRGIAAHAQRG